MAKQIIKKPGHKILDHNEVDKLIKKLKKLVSGINEINTTLSQNKVKVEISYDTYWYGGIEFEVQDYKVKYFKQI